MSLGLILVTALVLAAELLRPNISFARTNHSRWNL